MRQTLFLFSASLFTLIGCSQKIKDRPHGVLPAPPYQNLSVTKPLERQGEQRGAIETCESVFLKNLQSRDEQVLASTFQALALCHHPVSCTILSRYVLDESPLLQLAALQSLSILNTETSRALIHQALKSPYPVVRLEAAWRLIEVQEHRILSQIIALHDKLPHEFFIFLPELYAKESSPEAIAKLQKLAYEENDLVACQVFLAIYKYRLTNCENFVLSYQSHSPVVLEAIAQALELFDTPSSLKKLELLSEHENLFVRTRALTSRLALGDVRATRLVEDEWRQGNDLLPAAFVTSQTRGCTTLPYDREDITMLLYLLSSGDARSLPLIQKFLSSEKSTRYGTVFSPSISPGGTIVWWNAQPEPPSIQPHERLYLHEQSLELQEGILREALQQFDEDDVMPLLATIVQEERIDLYPVLFSLLQEVSYENFLAFYSKFSNTPGSPHIRAYLALAKMEREEHFDLQAMRQCFITARNGHWDEKERRISLPFIMNSLPEKFQGDDPTQRLGATTRLYLLSCQISLKMAQEEAEQLMQEELHQAPSEVAPFMAAALLESTI